MNLTKFKSALPVLIFLLSGTFASARKHPATGELPHSTKTNGLEFIENKGQWNAQVKFRADVPGGDMFITDKGFVYNYTSLPDMEQMHEDADGGKDVSNMTIHHHAYKVNFVGANTNIQYSTSGKSISYNNYMIGNDRSQWASRVGLYGKVNQQHIYNGIDANIYSKGTALKYDFVVAPGADLGQIKLSFDGVQPELTADGNLKITTSVNEIMEQAPYTYQMVNGVEKAIRSKYKLDKGVVSFELLQDYDHSLPLIIDPILVFATYSGGTTSFFYAYSSTYDQLGSMYVGAYYTASGTGGGWPTTVGAYQTTPSISGTDCINKYNATGSTRIYSTYFGGNGTSMANAMRVNNQNELVVVGSTNATNLGTTTNAYDATANGGTDFYVARFNVDGTALLGCTYVGGSSTDGATYDIFSGTPGAQTGLSASGITSPWELIFDNQNNIWVVGNTNSVDFPVTTNAFQSTNAGGYDGVVFKLNDSCTHLLYSSYFGGTSNDALYGIEFLSNGNVVVAGGTQSTNITTTAGTLHPAALGGWDGYIAVINPAQTTLVASSYLGTANDDNGTKLMVDGSDNIYVMGRTNGAYPISTGVYSIAGGDVFIDKLNASLTTSLVSTRVGSTTATRYLPTGFLLDICQNVYVAGLAPNSLNPGMPTTPDAFETNPRAFWFCVLEPNFSDLLFGSYYGSPTASDHPHCGTSRLDPQGIVYQSFCSTSPSFPTTAGSWSPTKQNGTMNDILSFKFNFQATGVNSNFNLDPILSGNDSGCVPYSVHFINTSIAALDYTWNFGDGTPTSNLSEPTHIYTTPGVYTVSLHANNDSSCITDDTSYMTMTILQTVPPDFTVNDTILCSLQQNINIGFTLNNPNPNNTIQWGPASGIIGASNTPHITVDPTVNNVYYAIVKDTIPGICGYSKTDTVHINLRPRELAIVNHDTVVCQGAVLPITSVGSTGYVYRWSPTTGVSDTTLLSPVITVNQANIYTLTGAYPGCPDTSVSINIGMQYIPQLTVSPDQFVCQWTDVALESNVTPYRNDYSYSWIPATPNLTHPNGPNTHLIADTTITYYLHIQTPIGCADVDTVNVTVFPGGFGGISPDTGYCPGQNSFASVRATGGASYAWSPSYGLSSATDATPIANPGQTTQYTVLITDAHNCLDTEKVKVSVYPAAQLNIPDSINIYPGENYQVQPGTNCSYFTWFPPSGLDNTNISDPHMSPEVRTRYFVTATTENGCVIKDSMDVLVNETVIDMPNAFNANSGTSFKPAKRGIAQLNSFEIFDRWGVKVYSSTNIDNGWDGTYKGKAQPLGVYIYIIQAVTDAGRTFTKQGTVTLIR
jgi:gliding motility-associated-like protein